MDLPYTLPTPDFAHVIAGALHISVSQVQAALRLLEQGNTIPFIARYRKEMTGELDENELRAIVVQSESAQALHARKVDVLRLLAEQGTLAAKTVAEPLVAAIVCAQTVSEVDDLYRPYRPKRKTRATIAHERGLAPLATWLRDAAARGITEAPTRAYAARFVDPDQGVEDTAVALQGAADIIAQDVADHAASRKWVRAVTMKQGLLTCHALDAGRDSVYAPYYEFSQPLLRVLPHRVLAINRGEREGYLRVSVSVEQAPITDRLLREHVPHAYRPQAGEVSQDALPDALLRVQTAISDGYKRLIAPAIEREIRAELTARAQEQAIRIFGENLRQLLLQPPMPGHVVLGVDPGFRTGCKLAVVDDTGRLLEVAVIYPTPPQSKVADATRTVLRMIRAHRISLIAIGNGTASRETEAFIVECTQMHHLDCGVRVPYVLVSEAGASVYSASLLAGEEFPELDVSLRSAVSIARRLQDPLAELVKIDPKSVGVGQYQHDVSEKRLDEKLTAVVETVVNQVGVDVNTASASLLSYVAGLNKTVAKNIVAYRESSGRFTSRKALAKVPRMGVKSLEQCVGFLRVPGGENVLDATPIHPESYSVVERLLAYSQVDSSALLEPQRRLHFLLQVGLMGHNELCAQVGVGAPTLRDILAALERPGRDPREDVPAPLLRTDVLKFDDLHVGMELTGTVRNVVDFGAFVDVGLKHDGLVHISHLSDTFVRHPLDAVAVGDVVTVRVLNIDEKRQRIGLSMRQRE